MKYLNNSYDFELLLDINLMYKKSIFFEDPQSNDKLNLLNVQFLNLVRLMVSKKNFVLKKRIKGSIMALK